MLFDVILGGLKSAHFEAHVAIFLAAIDSASLNHQYRTVDNQKSQKCEEKNI